MIPNQNRKGLDASLRREVTESDLAHWKKIVPKHHSSKTHKTLDLNSAREKNTK